MADGPLALEEECLSFTKRMLMTLAQDGWYLGVNSTRNYLHTNESTESSSFGKLAAERCFGKESVEKFMMELEDDEKTNSPSSSSSSSNPDEPKKLLTGDSTNGSSANNLLIDSQHTDDDAEARAEEIIDKGSSYSSFTSSTIIPFLKFLRPPKPPSNLKAPPSAVQKPTIDTSEKQIYNHPDPAFGLQRCKQNISFQQQHNLSCIMREWCGPDYIELQKCWRKFRILKEAKGAEGERMAYDHMGRHMCQPDIIKVCDCMREKFHDVVFKSTNAGGGS